MVGVRHGPWKEPATLTPGRIGNRPAPSAGPAVVAGLRSVLRPLPAPAGRFTLAVARDVRFAANPRRIQHDAEVGEVLRARLARAELC